MIQRAHVLVAGTIATLQGGDEGNPFVVSKPGSLFGANSLIVARPRPVTIKAIEQVETLFVPRSAFMKLCNQFPDLAARAADRIRKDLMGYVDVIETMRPKMGSAKR
jgi:CRP-like cAMP-binding protein